MFKGDWCACVFDEKIGNGRFWNLKYGFNQRYEAEEYLKNSFEQNPDDKVVCGVADSDVHGFVFLFFLLYTKKIWNLLNI